jgi:hypothetical protein
VHRSNMMSCVLLICPILFSFKLSFITSYILRLMIVKTSFAACQIFLISYDGEEAYSYT